MKSCATIDGITILYSVMEKPQEFNEVKMK